MVGQVRPAVNARVCTVAMWQIRLESLHHRGSTVELGGRNATEPPKAQRTEAGPETQGTAMQPVVIFFPMPQHSVVQLTACHLKRKKTLQVKYMVTFDDPSGA